MNAEEAPADRSGNVFADLPKCSVGTQLGEQFVQLLQRPGLRIERIVSTGQASPAGFWYDQDEDEWILLLAGEAGLRFADESTPRHLRAGDFLNIAAHRRHRVEWTASGQVTIWLAVHHGREAPANPR